MSRIIFVLVALLVGASLGAAQNYGERIIGGSNATITEYPYAIQVEYYELVCGGVLVAPQWVLTAAGCFYDRDLEVFIFRAGTTDLLSGGQTFNMSEIVFHPQFDWNTNDYDAALVLLNASVAAPYNQTVEMVSEDTDIPFGENITAVGWGWINEEYYIDNYPTTLQVVDLPILDDETCKSTLSNYNVYTDRMFCGGYLAGGKGICFGDIGGPVLYQDRLIGLSCWTDNCARANRPSAFTKISAIRSWIDSIINR